MDSSQNSTTIVSLLTMYKMETQKIVNLLNDTDNESSKIASRKSYFINDQNNTKYGGGNENDSSIRVETKAIKSSICADSDAHILVKRNIAATGGSANTEVAFENGLLFTICVTHINDEHVDTAENFDIIMPMYNLIEYSDNYSYTSGSLWQFKRDESDTDNAGNPADVTTDDSTSFKFKSVFLQIQMLMEYYEI